MTARTAYTQEKLRSLLGVDLPLVQAPMAGVDTVQLAAAASQAGGLGSLACPLLTAAQLRAAWAELRALTAKPVNLNFFCHSMPAPDAARERRWRARLAPYYAEWGINSEALPDVPLRLPFDAQICAVVEEIKPEIVSFHFGLPVPPLLARVRSTGAKILSTATTVAEAVWLEQNGCDAIIAQGIEAGGHRGLFLTDDLSTQMPLGDLLPAILSAVSLPVIAAGGIADAQGVAAVLRAGAVAAQLGTAYLFCPEARVSPLYRASLQSWPAADTAVTNLYSGRPARGLLTRLMREMGPMAADAPDFPYAAKYVAPLRQKAEAAGAADFSQMWAGTGFAAGRAGPAQGAQQLTKNLAEDALALL